jgi:hypothetical protein
MWTHKNTFAIGGLENVGYAPQQDVLIVLSTQGQGIFDCRLGERLAREYDNANWWYQFNQTTHSIVGFDILEHIEIRTCGVYGDDHLAKSSSDGWSLVISEPEPDDIPFEKYLVRRVFLVSPDKDTQLLVGKDGACELRAFGFSDTGNTFVIALSCELVIYSRS